MPNNFDEVANYLSQFQLKDLIIASSLFSTMEFQENFPNGDCYYNPMMNFVKSNMFTKAVLNSESDYNKRKRFSPQYLPWILNTLSEAADNKDVIEDDKLDDDEKLDQIILSMFSSQLWYNRDITKERIPLLYSLYVKLPNEHRKELQNKHQDHFVDIPNFISENLGIPLEKYLLTSIFLSYILPKQVYSQALIPNAKFKKLIESLPPDDQRHLELRQNLVLQQASRLDEFYPLLTFSHKPVFFSKNHILKILQFLTKDEFNSYLSLTSKTIIDLRELNKQEPYQLGHISQSLTPLERYPITKLMGSYYIIPNLRFFEISITELIRFALQESFQNNQFNEVMGSVQELLIIELLKQLVSDDLILVPERPYTKNNSEYRGPDLIVIDKGRPILIESKAKQLLLKTRLNPDGKPLNENLKSVIKAIVELNENKFDDLYSEEVYSDIQPTLSKPENCEPLFVGIVAEGVITMQEQITKIKNKNSRHPLNSVEYPHIFFDVYHLYKIIEICKTNSLSIYECLYKYWENGNKIEPKEYSADSFEGMGYNKMESYSKSKMDTMIYDAHNNS